MTYMKEIMKREDFEKVLRDADDSKRRGLIRRWGTEFEKAITGDLCGLG